MKKFSILIILSYAFCQLQAQNVGIGTTTPATKLDVKSTSSNVAQFNGPSPMYMSIFENDLYRGYWGSYSGNPEDVDFGTGGGNGTGKLHLTIQGTPKMTLDAGGKVGIGTTTPGYLLDVANRMRLNQGTLNNLFTTPGIWLTDYRTGTDRMFTGMQDSIRWGIYGGGSGGFGWGFNFNSKNGNVNIGNSTGETYRLQVSGSDYGIGLYNAAGNFFGDMLSDASDNLLIESQYSSIFGGTTAKHILLNPPSPTIFFSPGNVGVNTNTPNAKFHVGGTVYIGTSTGAPAAGYQLSVKGKIISEEVKVSLSSSWPDYVFGNNYKLMPLEQLEQSINANKHLPNIPAAAEVENNGIMLGDMNKRLMEKIEELTLYIIDINKKNSALTEKVEKLERQINNNQ